jgi:uncharacterized membrane protein HdeD (DUF308 family)
MAELFWQLGKTSFGSAFLLSGLMKIFFSFILLGVAEIEIETKDVLVSIALIFFGAYLFIYGLRGLSNLKS